jgi:hypothetical protein
VQHRPKTNRLMSGQFISVLPTSSPPSSVLLSLFNPTFVQQFSQTLQYNHLLLNLTFRSAHQLFLELEIS